MQLAYIYSRSSIGLDAIGIKVEVHISSGLPKMHIVGLPETVVRESKHRVRSAIIQNGFQFPAKVVTVNLAPADLPKGGGRFDLPIALGILVASDQLPNTICSDYEFIGELSLSGALLPVKGIIPSILAANNCQRKIIIPRDNTAEAQLIRKPNVYIADHLIEICHHLTGHTKLSGAPQDKNLKSLSHSLDMRDVYGQHRAVRAMEICAAGRHHCLMMGSPGSGKTMIANRLPTLLPPLDEEEALTSAAILSLTHQNFGKNDFYRRAFRSPHHTCSAVALVGGGNPPQPGEISKAHNGILFLDELPEFQRKALDALREPLETGLIHLSRAAYSVQYPARFQLIAAMNPCPNGMDIDQYGRCPCDDKKLANYYNRISAPMIDRFDMHISVPRIKWSSDKSLRSRCEASDVIAKRVSAAHKKQINRQGKLNADLKIGEIEKFCKLSADDQKMFYSTLDKLKLSNRAMHRILKVSRTIADLNDSENITTSQLLEAISYRSMTRLKTV